MRFKKLLWKELYKTVWLAFFPCVLIPRWMGSHVGFPVHMLLGLILLIRTQLNMRRLAAVAVPARLQRISKVTAGFAIFQIISGLALGGAIHLVPDSQIVPAVLRGIHVACALAILAQTSSVATAYDMWEEKEFTSE